jgi:hypothetical protein
MGTCSTRLVMWFEEFCSAVLQLATLMQRDMAGFNLIVTARLREIAENANESMGGLTLGAAVLKAQLMMQTVVELGQVSHTIPLTAPEQGTAFFGQAGASLANAQPVVNQPPA